MSDALRIETVADKQDLETFITLPDAIYAGDPHYVKPLMMERKDLLDREKNPYFEHAEAEYWIAWRGDKPVGRISAQVCQLTQAQVGEGLAHFGMFESEDNAETADALMRTAENWALERGMTRLQGPYNLSINAESGLLVDGFDTPPAVMMGHAPARYASTLESLGYAKAMDMHALEIMVSEYFPGTINRVVEMAERSKKMTFRPIDMKQYREELDTIINIFNEAWADNWGFVPLTSAEINHMAKEMRPLITPHRTRICEYDGEPVAFMIVIPDINDLIKDLNGKLLPFNWIKLLWRLKVGYPKRLRVPLMGVKPRFQGKASGAAMAFTMIEYIRREVAPRGSEWAEMGWILESNTPMLKILEDLGTRIYKTYRIYEKQLG